MLTFEVERLSNNRLRFQGVDMGGGHSEVPIIAEDGPIVVIRTPGVTVYRGPGHGYQYEKVRYEVYQLMKVTRRRGRFQALRLISFTPRRKRG